MRRAEEVIVILLSGGRMDDGSGFVHQRSDKDRWSPVLFALPNRDKQNMGSSHKAITGR